MQKDPSLPETGREIRMWVRDTDLTPLTSAQLDFYLVDGSHALILDFKSGFNRPTASELSWQSRTQSVALWQAFPQLTHIRAGFASSRLTSHLDLTDYSVSDLERVYKELRHVLWRTQQPNAPRVPGAHCRYCKARGSVNCPESVIAVAVHTNGIATVKGRGGALKADELQVALKVSRMSPAELGYVYKRKSVFESVFEAMGDRLRGMTQEQLAEAGYALSDGRAVRSINDDTLAFKRILGTLTEEERVQCIEFSYTAAYKILAKRSGISEEEAKTQVLSALGDCVTEKESAKRLKPIC